MQSQQRHADVHLNKPHVLPDASDVMHEKLFMLDVLYMSHTGMLQKASPYSISSVYRSSTALQELPLLAS